MPQTTYSLAISTLAQKRLAAEIMEAVFVHLEVWKRLHNIDFLSCVVNGAQLDVTFSDVVPPVERQHIRMSVT